jgi:hypothetical protein
MRAFVFGVVLGVVGILGFQRYDELARWKPEPVKVKVEQAKAAPKPVVVHERFARPAKLIGVRAEELAQVQGTVKDVTPEGIVVVCQWPAYEAATSIAIQSHGYPVMSAGDSKNLANLAIDSAKRKREENYGKLMEARGGQLVTARWEPQREVNGTVLVFGVPGTTQIEPGMGVRFVVADPKCAYWWGDERILVATMDYEMKSGEWMWKR